MKLLTAGLELIKGNFDDAVKSLSYIQPLIPSTYRGNDPIAESQWHFWSPGFQNEIGFNYSDTSSAWYAYTHCSPLSSIVNRKVRASLNGKTWVMNPKGKEAATEPANRIRALLRRPNILQNHFQFLTQLKVYLQVFDYAVVFCKPPVGMDRTFASSMWCVPPQYLKIQQKQVPLYDIKTVQECITSIKFCIGGNEYPISLDDIFIFTTGAVSATGIIPTNKIQLLSDPIGNIISAMNSRATLIKRRGALGIISPKAKDGTGAVTIPLKPSEKDELQREWRRYGTQSDQNNVVISNASIDWTRITMDVGELKLMEEVQDSSKMICDGYGFPPHLLGLLDPTFNNQNAAEKGLYQNTIIPETQVETQQWEEFFSCNDYRLSIENDFSALPIMQEDKKAFAESRLTLGQELRAEFFSNTIPYNRMLEILGEDTVPEMEGKYYRDLIAQGWIFGNDSSRGGTQSPQTTTNQQNATATTEAAA